MTQNNNRRLSTLEIEVKNQRETFSDDIHEIKQDVHDIKKDVADGKKVTDMNTDEIKKGNKLTEDMLLIQTEFLSMFKGGVFVLKIIWKFLKWTFATALAAGGLYLGYLGIIL